MKHAVDLQRVKDQEEHRVLRILLISLTSTQPIVDGICGYCHTNKVIHLIDCQWQNAVECLDAMEFKKNKKERQWWEGTMGFINKKE